MQIAREGAVGRNWGLFALLAALVGVFAIAARQGGPVKPARNAAAVAVAERAPQRMSPVDRAGHLEIRPQRDWLDPPEPGTGEIPCDSTFESNIVLVEFDVARNGDWMLAPVIIGGREYKFLIDTGCTLCVVDNELESVLRETGKTARLNGRGGFAVYHLPQAFLGKRKLPVEGPVMCWDLEPFRELSGHDIRGILGMTFLRQHIVQFDFDAGKLAFLRTCPADAGHRFQLSYTETNTPALELNVGQGQSVSFEIDTGCMSSHAGQLDRSTFQRLTRNGRLIDTGKTIGHMTVLGPEYQRIGLLASLQLDPFEHADLEFTESAINRLALGYLSRYVMTFDFPNDSLHLRKGKRYEQPASGNLLGAGFRRIGPDTFVTDIDPSSPAGYCGLQEGDRLLSIDGTDCSSFSVFELYQLFRERGRQYSVVLQGRDEPRQIDVSIPDWQKFVFAIRTVIGEKLDDSAEDMNPASPPSSEIQADRTTAQQTAELSRP